jgi:hypothetical protein
MSRCPCDEKTSRIRTRLETALVRLNGSLRTTAQRGEAMDSMFNQWQNRWSSRREDIVRRLEAIDSQLDVWKPSGNATPRFAVVSAAEEAGTGLGF